MFGKNDVYVVFRVGSKKVKTHHIKNAGKHASFGEILTMNLSDSDLEHRGRSRTTEGSTRRPILGVSREEEVHKDER